MGDTIIEGKQANIIVNNILRYNGISIDGDTTIGYEDNSGVYYLTKGSFELMYDFSPNAGDTLKVVFD